MSKTWNGRHILMVAVCAAAVVSGVASGNAADLKAEAVIRQQQDWFARLQTVQLKSRKELKLSAERKASQKIAADALYNDEVFAAKGNKFYSKVVAHDGTGLQKGGIVYAFDGQSYQVLRLEGENRLLVTSKAPLHDVQPYGTSTILLHPYAFAFPVAGARSIDRFRSAEVWSAVLGKLSASEEGSHEGRDGIWLTFIVTDACVKADVTYDVFFAADLQYLPVYWKWTNTGADLATESRVLSTAEFAEPDGRRIFVPTRIVAVERKNGVVRSEVDIQVKANTLRINQPFDDAIFTIPKSEATYWKDLDTGVHSP